MSRIYFHSEYGTAELSGSERAYAGCLCSDLLISALTLRFTRPVNETILPLLLPPNHYILRDDYLNPGRVSAALNPTNCDEATWQGKPLDLFTVALNTMLAFGSDPVKLLARLHGQCEIHAYVEGPNREWLAGIIESGRELGVLRVNEGWESVASLLRSRSDCPVVTSYSVCMSFPNRHAANFQSALEEDEDAFYDLSAEEQWRLGMKGIRGCGSGMLEMKPDDWATYYFKDGLTAFEIMEEFDSIKSGTPNSLSPAPANPAR